MSTDQKTSGKVRDRDETESRYGNWELIKRLLGLSWAYRLDCVRIILLQMATLAFVILAIRYAGLGVDVIHRYVNPNAKVPEWPFGLEAPGAWEPIQVLGIIAAAVVVFAVLRAYFLYAYGISVARLVQGKVVPELRGKVYEKMQKLSFRFFDANASSSIINRVTGDVQNVRIFVDGVLVEVLVILLSLLFFVSYMASIHLLLTLACVATTPLIWVICVGFSKKARPAFVENRRLIDFNILRLIETVQGIHAIKGFGREREEREKFVSSSDAVRDQMQTVIRLVSVFSPKIGFLTKINFMVLLSYGGFLVYQGDLALGTGIIVFEGLLRRYSEQVGNISGLANKVQRSLTGARRVFEILDTPIEIESLEGAALLGKTNGAVTFEGVSFAYDEDHTVLSDVSFATKPGQTVAIAGPTGAGKTALLSLIPRFYDPERGRVTIGGVDLREMDLDELRRSIGIVFQESFMFSNTIASNIAFGAPYATREQIERAAKVACAHDFIMEMPLGYDSVLGESASNLSGGQRQRLAIARAVLLEPAILILDDPTASIDAETEDVILRAMDNAMKDRTTFLVAHRMSALRRADIVVVLEKGRVAQVGTHKELMSQEGHYRDNARLQAVEGVQLRNAILDKRRREEASR